MVMVRNPRSLNSNLPGVPAVPAAAAAIVADNLLPLLHSPAECLVLCERVRKLDDLGIMNTHGDESWKTVLCFIKHLEERQRNLARVARGEGEASISLVVVARFRSFSAFFRFPSLARLRVNHGVYTNLAHCRETGCGIH